MTGRIGRRRAGPWLALAGVLLLSPAGPAAADGSGTPDASGAAITLVQPTEDGVELLVSVPAGAELDLDAVRVTIAGEDAEATAEAATTAERIRRTAVLAIDTSNSMSGPRFESAKAAALQFLDSVPPDVRVGIVAFADEVTEVLPPGQDRARARSTVAELSLSRRTRLYDGVLAGVRMAGEEGQRSLLLLSDGADTTRTPLDRVTAAIERSGVLVDVVALDQADTALPALEQVAAAGDGQVIAADSEALAAAFVGQASELARQVYVTATLPASVTADQDTVRVTLPTADGAIDVRAFTALRQAGTAPTTMPTLPAVEPGWSPPVWAMYLGVAALGIGLVGLVAALVPTGPRRATAVERVNTYAAATRTGGARGSAAPGTGARVDAEEVLTQAKGAAAHMLRRNKSLEARITQRLEAAGSELKSAEWLLLHAAIFLVAGLVGLMLGGGSVLTGLLFLALGVVGPWLYLGIRRGRRRKAFGSSLPDTLQLMSGSLAAGLSLPQSVDTVVREGAEPIASEFKRVLVESRLGVSVEDALEGVAQRFDSKDFAWVVMAIRIQRQVGGNLAELFETVAATMREREYVRRQVAALAAEGKLSAWVLGGLPPLFLGYLVLTKGEYVAPLFTDPRGWIMLIGGAVWLTVGVFWMSRLIKVEV